MSFTKHIALAVLFTASLAHAAKDLGETCITDGGYIEGVECVGSCRDTVNDAPFTTENDPHMSPSKTTNETWCATVANYQTTGSTKKQWGFCMCTPNTAAPTGQPTPWEPQDIYRAYGGYQAEETDCVLDTVQVEAGGEKMPVTGCLPVEGYDLYRVENAKWTGGNYSMWCPTIANFKLHLSTGTSANREHLRSWGFCKMMQSTREPTGSPTAEPTTGTPTMEPTTGTPSATPTKQPTAFVPVTTLVASGGWLSAPTECTLGGKITINSDGDYVNVTGCLSVDDYELFVGKDTSSIWFGGNLSMWCPTTDNFKIWKDSSVVANRPDLRKWGYCSSVTTSRAPTMEPTAWQSETMYYATGGGVGVSANSQAEEGKNMEPCLMPFTIKNKDGEWNSCLNISEFAPDMTENGDFPAMPMDGAPTDMWCPIGKVSEGDDRYNPTNAEKSDRWGYCVEVQSTRAPVDGGPAVTKSPTMATDPPTAPETGAPTTTSPTMSPLVPGNTRAPTSPVTAAPTMNPTSNCFTVKPNFIFAAFFVILAVLS